MNEIFHAISWSNAAHTTKYGIKTGFDNARI